MKTVVARIILTVIGVLAATVAVSREENLKKHDALPVPLTLEYALNVSVDQHPSLQKLQAAIQSTFAHKKIIDANDNLEVNLEAIARWVEPSDKAVDQSSGDHRLGVIASKSLYDFGRQQAKSDAAELDIASQQMRYQQGIVEHRIQVMRRFFDVLLADLKFYRYNEEMAVAYIQWDRKRERLRLKQAIDVDVLELETEYQKIRRLRYHSEAMQRQTRARLAAILNRPGDLPASLASPILPILNQKLPPVEELQKQALKNNIGLLVLRKRIESAQQHVKAARSSYDPTLTGKLEAYSYARELGSSDTWRTGVTLNVPLYSGNRSVAQLTQAKANEYQTIAELREAEYNVSQSVLETWLKIDTLRIQREEMRTRADFEEMALDQRRALYELEIRSDLGKAMVRVSEAEYQLKRTEYEMAIAWERLKLLTGQFVNQSSTDKSSLQGAMNE